MPLISPTVGRRVWFFESAQHRQAFDAGVWAAQPFDAGVIFVHDDRTVNLMVTSHDGQLRYASGITLQQEGDPIPEGAHAIWMPYQQKQAAKAEPIEDAKAAAQEELGAKL